MIFYLKYFPEEFYVISLHIFDCSWVKIPDGLQNRLLTNTDFQVEEM